MKARICVKGTPGTDGCFGDETEDEVCNLEVPTKKFSPNFCDCTL